MKVDTLRFLDPRDPLTGYLSNFYRAGFELEGRTWPTVEHCYQAQKFPGSAHADAIRQAETPRKAKQLGQATSPPRRSDWDAVKLRLMLGALVAKFVQHPDLAKRLIGTRDQVLIEAHPDDAYWGEGPGQGANRLGRLLMALRAALPEADRRNMQARGDAAALQAGCEADAWDLFNDPEFRPETRERRFGFDVLTVPLYGQSLVQIARCLQPYLGHELAAAQVDAQGCTLRWTTAPAPVCEGDPMPFAALEVRPDCAWRFGVDPQPSVAVTQADPEGPSPARPGWLPPSWGGRACVDAVWARPGPGQDTLTGWHFAPAAEALALELAPQSAGAGETSLYLLIHARPQGFLRKRYAARAEGPRARGPDPQEPAWQRIACAERRGAMPRLQRQFAERFRHWGGELPLDDVCQRRAGCFEDDWLALAGWMISYAFGRDERGEYVEIDSDHRMTSPSRDRIYADGTVVSLE